MWCSVWIDTFFYHCVGWYWCHSAKLLMNSHGQLVPCCSFCKLRKNIWLHGIHSNVMFDGTPLVLLIRMHTRCRWQEMWLLEFHQLLMCCSVNSLCACQTFHLTCAYHKLMPKYHCARSVVCTEHLRRTTANDWMLQCLGSGCFSACVILCSDSSICP